MAEHLVADDAELRPGPTRAQKDVPGLGDYDVLVDPVRWLPKRDLALA